MTLTVSQVAAFPGLGLSVVTTSADLRREVRWVATSELSDPGPWLDGGELLLTTGMRLRDDDESCSAYVQAVVDGGAAALGFGVGLSFDAIPLALLRAAERLGLPVIEVPIPTPFVAVSKAVSLALAADEYRAAERSFEAQRALIRAALREDGDTEVVALLAKHLEGFVLRVDVRGVVQWASPASAAGRGAEFQQEVDRLRPKGVLASAAVSSADEHVVIIPLGVRGSAQGFVIVGTARALRSNDVAVMNLAVSLLSWRLVRDVDRGNAWHRLVIDAIQRDGAASVAMAELGLADLVHADARIVAAVSLESGADLAMALTALPGVIAALTEPRLVLALVPGSADEQPLLTEVLRSADSAAVSGLIDLDDSEAVQVTIAQAKRLARSGTGAGTVTGTGIRYLDDPSAMGLSALIDPATAQSWARDYLAGVLASPESRELIETLRAWLTNHAQVDATGSALGVHRHTVRHRLKRAETLLERPLDDPAVRADLWFALAQVPMFDGADGGSPQSG